MGLVLASLTDTELVDCLRNGNNSAYEELYIRHKELVAKIVKYELASMSIQDRQDVVEEAFLSTYRIIQQGKGPQENFAAYLVTVARNACRRYRAMSHRCAIYTDSQTLVHLEQDVNSTLRNAIDDDETYRLYEQSELDGPFKVALQSLPALDATLLWKHCVEGISYKQLVAETGLSIHSLYNRMDMVKKRFRSRLEIEQRRHLQESIQNGVNSDNLVITENPIMKHL